MSRFLSPILRIAPLLILGLAACGTAADRSDGWIPLFDGESLAGWTLSRENPDSFVVEEGALVARGGRSHLFYSGLVGGADFKDFELKMRVRTTPGSNSGVYFHTQYQDRGWPSVGFEAQVNTSHSDPKKTGSLYAVANVYVPDKPEEPFLMRLGKNGIEVYQENAPSKDGLWFDYHLIVDGDTVTIRVDGKTIVEWTQPEDWQGPKPSMDGRVLGSGTFAIQAHDPKSEVHYKDIKVRLR